MTVFLPDIELPPTALIIEEEDRPQSGRYQIESGSLNIFPFEILTDKQFRVPIRHLNTNDALHQNLSLRVWISTQPNGIELFFRFHPTTGGLSHIFYDVNKTMVPVPKSQPPARSEFNGITYIVRDELIPLDPGVYYYNVLNMENRLNAYELFFDPYEDC